MEPLLSMNAEGHSSASRVYPTSEVLTKTGRVFLKKPNLQMFPKPFEISHLSRVRKAL